MVATKQSIFLTALQVGLNGTAWDHAEASMDSCTQGVHCACKMFMKLATVYSKRYFFTKLTLRDG
jgi:hypothetical protein